MKRKHTLTIIVVFEDKDVVCKHKPKYSSVCKHARAGHRIDWDNMEILDKAKDRWRLLLKEMLHINKLKPQLNIQKSSKLFSLIIGTQEDSDATRT
jgi:phage pi2 protein 07